MTAPRLCIFQNNRGAYFIYNLFFDINLCENMILNWELARAQARAPGADVRALPHVQCFAAGHQPEPHVCSPRPEQEA